MIRDEIQIESVNVQLVSGGTILVNEPAVSIFGEEIPDDEGIVADVLGYARDELGLSPKSGDYIATTGEGVILVMPNPVYAFVVAFGGFGM